MEISIKTLPEREVAFVSYKGNYVGNAEIFQKLFGQLHSLIEKKPEIAGPDTLFMALYQQDPKITPPDELCVEVAMTIPSGIDVEGEITKKTIPSGEYAVGHAKITDPSEYQTLWMEVVEWAAKQGYEADMSKPSLEVYLNNPEEHPEKLHVVDICFCIKKQ